MESQTRQYWRTRLTAMLSGGWNEMNEKDFTEHVESWLDDFMQTPELSLAEAAEAPNLRLAVVDVGLQPVLYRQERGVEGLLHYIEELDAYRVVKMEEK